MTLHYAGQIGGPFGWGTLGENITRELAAHYRIVGADESPDVVLMPLNNPDLSPRSPARGKLNLGICFFESSLSQPAFYNSTKLDTVFVGSTWCKERCAEAGIHNTRVLMQGVDSAIFSPQPPRNPDGQFRIFSGGKFEWRKGQDLVIKAFAEFAKREPAAHLVCAWFNPWPVLIFEAVDKSGLALPRFGTLTQEKYFEDLLMANGVPRCHFTVLPALSQADLAREMANTDCGLFPNRCEGGTNLVLMEYASLGRRVIANAGTGHAEITEAIAYILPSSEDENGWAVQRHLELYAALVVTREHPELVELTNPPAPAWTWAASAQTVADEVARLTAARGAA